jgi:hypothetical protein
MYDKDPGHAHYIFPEGFLMFLLKGGTVDPMTKERDKKILQDPSYRLRLEEVPDAKSGGTQVKIFSTHLNFYNRLEGCISYNKNGFRHGPACSFIENEIDVHIDFRNGVANGFVNYLLGDHLDRQVACQGNLYHGPSRSFKIDGTEDKKETRYFWKGKLVPQPLYWWKANVDYLKRGRLDKWLVNLFRRNGDDVAAEASRNASLELQGKFQL